MSKGGMLSIEGPSYAHGGLNIRARNRPSAIFGPGAGSGFGTSIYLFDSEAAARHFLAGPILEHRLNGPDVSGVSFDLTHIDDAEQDAMATSIARARTSATI